MRAAFDSETTNFTSFGKSNEADRMTGHDKYEEKRIFVPHN